MWKHAGFGAICGAAIALATSVIADYVPYRDSLGSDVQPVVIHCATGVGNAAVPCGALASPFATMSMPFRRLHSAPIRLASLGTTPKSFAISRPSTATTYRIVIPCDVNVRVLGTMAAGESVTTDTGVLYLAGTESTMGTTRPNFISAMTVGTPTADCTPEMHYGMGGG